MKELKPCPFCGGEAFIVHFAKDACYVKCENNDCMAGQKVYGTKAEAIAAWNARTERTCYADEVTHLDCKYSVNRGWKERTCEQEEREWGTEGNHARVWLTCGHDCMVHTVAVLPSYCPTCGAKVIEEKGKGND